MEDSVLRFADHDVYHHRFLTELIPRLAVSHPLFCHNLVIKASVKESLKGTLEFVPIPALILGCVGQNGLEIAVGVSQTLRIAPTQLNAHPQVATAQMDLALGNGDDEAYKSLVLLTLFSICPCGEVASAAAFL
jgi:hypothetical protein